MGTSSLEALQAKAATFALDYNPALLQNPEFFKVFETAIKGLYLQNQEDAYNHFQATAYDYLDHGRLRDIHPTVLRIALYCKNRNLSDIASALLRAAESQLARSPSSNEAKEEVFRSWAECNHCKDEKIKISWGGGDLFLSEFLEGKSEGYAAEAGGVGIFVTTSDNYRDRDQLYATRTPLYHFDNPCVLTAEIDPKALLQVNHNGYEAVLPKKCVPLLQKVHRQSWKLNEMPFSKRKNCVQQTLPAGRMDPKTWTIDWRPILIKEAEGQYSLERIDRFVRSYNELSE